MPSLTGLVCFSGNVLLETYRAYRHSVTGMDCELSLSEVLSRVSDGMSIARTIPSKFKVPEGRHVVPELIFRAYLRYCVKPFCRYAAMPVDKATALQIFENFGNPGCICDSRLPGGEIHF